MYHALSLVQRHCSNNFPFSLFYILIFFLSALSLPAVQKHGILSYFTEKKPFSWLHFLVLGHHSITLLPIAINPLERVIYLSWHKFFSSQNLLTLSPCTFLGFCFCPAITFKYTINFYMLCWLYLSAFPWWYIISTMPGIFYLLLPDGHWASIKLTSIKWELKKVYWRNWWRNAWLLPLLQHLHVLCSQYMLCISWSCPLHYLCNFL